MLSAQVYGNSIAGVSAVLPTAIEVMLCMSRFKGCFETHIDRLMQERGNSIANAQELRLSCTNPSHDFFVFNL